MTTQLIGVKEFRQNMASIAKMARKDKIRFIILNRNEPIFELRPLDNKNASFDKLMRDLDEAKDDIKAGRTYSLKQTRKKLGL